MTSTFYPIYHELLTTVRLNIDKSTSTWWKNATNATVKLISNVP